MTLPLRREERITISVRIAQLITREMIPEAHRKSRDTMTVYRTGVIDGALGDAAANTMRKAPPIANAYREGYAFGAEHRQELLA